MAVEPFQARGGILRHGRGIRRLPKSRILLVVVTLAMCLSLAMEGPATMNYVSSPSSTRLDGHPSFDCQVQHHKNLSSDEARADRILIGQYGNAPLQASASAYNELLNATALINRLYAERHGYDYVQCQGTYFSNAFTFRDLQHWLLRKPVPHPPPSRSTYDKIGLLAYAMDHDYDRLLLLDADAMVSDWDWQAASAYFGYDGSHDDDVLLVAHRVVAQPMDNWNVNIGVTLWNLKHRLAEHVWNDWDRRSRKRVRRGLHDDDQKTLQSILKEPKIMKHVKPVSGELGYENGSIVKHFIRTTSASWTQNADDRLRAIQEQSNRILERYGWHS